MSVVEFIYQLIKNSKSEVKVMILHYNDFLHLKSLCGVFTNDIFF